MSGPKKVSPKNRYYKLLRVGKDQLGWDDDFYYETFLPNFGAKKKGDKYSASTLSLGQLMQAFDHMKACGFKPVSKKGSAHAVADWRKARIEKITAIWCALHDAGVVYDRSEKAMVKWCASVTKNARLQWYKTHELNMCIEGLKDWARREGVKLEH